MGYFGLMSSISRLDRLVAQLRAQLQNRARNAPVYPRATGGQTNAASPSPLQAVAALKAAGVADEAVLVRALVEGMLRDELGRDLVNAVAFQQTVETVVDALSSDHEVWSLCRSYVDQA